MREIIAFIQKEFRHIFRDLRTTLIVLVMPVVQIILFGFAISTDVSNAVVDVVGDACDPLARCVISRIEGNKYLAVGEIHGSFAPARDRIRKGKAAAALCFGTDFDGKAGSEGKACVRIVSDGSDPNTAQVVTSYIKGVLQSEELALSESLAGKPKASMRPNVQLMYNPAMNSSYNFVPGVMGLILMLICSMMTAVSIVKEKETGTLELLLVSPVKPFWIILSKMIPYLALSVVNFVSVLLLAHFVMGGADPWQPDATVPGVACFRRFVTGTRTACVSHLQDTADSDAAVRYGTDNADHDAVRHHIPVREHAGRSSDALRHHPCQVVHHHGEEDNDPGSRP